MKRDHKIEKINAYTKLLQTRKLPKPAEKADANDTANNVSEEINREFLAWAEAQLADLLGEGGPKEGEKTSDERSDVFTKSQVAALRGLADAVIMKQNLARGTTPQAEQETSEAPAPRRAPRQLSEADKLIMQRAQPLLTPEERTSTNRRPRPAPKGADAQQELLHNLGELERHNFDPND